MRKKSLQQLEDLLDRRQARFDERQTPALPEQRTPADDSAMQSAEAFDALRQEVMQLRIDRQSHQAHLAEIHRVLVAAVGSGSVKVPLLMANDLLRQIGVAVVTDIEQRHLFSSLDDDNEDDASYVVVQPAYVEDSTGRVVRQGRIRAAAQVAQ